MKRTLLIARCLMPLTLSSGAMAQAIEYTDEATFLSDLTGMGYQVSSEDFDQGVWENYRYPGGLGTSITAGFLTWSGNGDTTTNLNWGRHGTYGVFTINGPLVPEFYHIESTRTLYAAGGWINSNPDTGADMGIIIDGVIVASRNIGAGHQFIGVIYPAGFSTVEFRELEAEAVIGADDFSFGVLPECTADFNNDGVLDFFDVSAFLAAFAAQDPSADLNGDGVFDFFDVSTYLNLFAVGCP